MQRQKAANGPRRPNRQHRNRLCICFHALSFATFGSPHLYELVYSSSSRRMTTGNQETFPLTVITLNSETIRFLFPVENVSIVPGSPMSASYAIPSERRIFECQGIVISIVLFRYTAQLLFIIMNTVHIIA
ncbi:hypothetical protein [Paenibacillus sp. yr247]|uniref:hypothetical protein n=1 Tax=Paenibacillus sp. yr247 TaxID=1761880 RepID=UPI0015877185|nr:hypothetical protein [Paenibacillus sp. yr247]